MATDDLWETISEAFHRASSSVFLLDDGQLAYSLFEQFDSLAPYLTEQFLGDLLERERISKSLYFVGMAIGELWRSLQCPQDWSIEKIRGDNSLEQLAVLCDWCLSEIANGRSQTKGSQLND